MRYPVYNDIKLYDFLKGFNLSKSKIYKIVQDLNKKNKKYNNDYILPARTVLDINEDIIRKNTYKKIKKPIYIIYEDDFLLVVRKPSRILIHSDGNESITMDNIVSNYLKNDDVLFDHIHRLDYETTGMVIYGKGLLTISKLNYMMEQGLIKKEYSLIVHGQLGNRKGIINLPIGKDRHSNKQRVSPNGKKCSTEYEVIKVVNNTSKIKCIIHGGRRHQIRVHFSHIKHPIVGDKLYGEFNPDIDMKLHFRKVYLRHPITDKELIIEDKENF